MKLYWNNRADRIYGKKDGGNTSGAQQIILCFAAEDVGPLIKLSDVLKPHWQNGEGDAQVEWLTVENKSNRFKKVEILNFTIFVLYLLFIDYRQHIFNRYNDLKVTVVIMCSLMLKTL